ncbi:hypothetical protein A6302_03973 [Methylobrevis pamukkalensis]|uniref:Uncharacterized protein n=1 Tax=Methylobrevis pamukkalensis TaxID=1439726 RepID=A0A1E3GXE2_9HYPH|nr:hypothetical protein A6302_03973 [Methylobrevis pamukkalensis]
MPEAGSSPDGRDTAASEGTDASAAATKGAGIEVGAAAGGSGAAASRDLSSTAGAADGRTTAAVASAPVPARLAEASVAGVTAGGVVVTGAGDAATTGADTAGTAAPTCAGSACTTVLGAWVACDGSAAPSTEGAGAGAADKAGGIAVPDAGRIATGWEEVIRGPAAPIVTGVAGASSMDGAIAAVPARTAPNDAVAVITPVVAPRPAGWGTDVVAATGNREIGSADMGFLVTASIVSKWRASRAGCGACAESRAKTSSSDDRPCEFR